MNRMELKANLGFIIRGDYSDLTDFSEKLEKLIIETGVQMVHKHASASKLWIREGDEVNELRSLGE